MEQPLHLSPDSLLAHEPFVRAVVRDLLKDEHHVQDVLQETWLRALDRGPRERGSLKGWLASVARSLAVDQHRRSTRRAQREREAARGEALESVDALHARLEAQREVVDAVLALEEPYKSVVLLAYYEQLAPQAIGARLGRSAATVRSQLSRAHEILKRRLDAHHGGDRAAWAGVLLPMIASTKSKTGVAITAGIGIALLGTAVWLVPQALRGGPASPKVPLQLASGSSAEPSEPSTAVELDKSASARAALPVDAAPKQATVGRRPSPEEIKSATTADLLALAVQDMRQLERKLLTPDPRYVREQQSLLAMPDTGLARLIMRTNGASPYEEQLLMNGGGSYFSFASKSQDSDLDPDVFYEGGSLKVQIGSLLKVGELPLEEIQASPAALPRTLGVDDRGRWDALFVPVDWKDKRASGVFLDRQLEQGHPGAPAEIGQTYLVRCFGMAGHDLLAGLRVLGADEGSITIAWRIIHQNWLPDPKPRHVARPTYDSIPSAPAWMEALGVDELVTLLRSVRAVSEARLLTVPERDVRASAWLREGAEESAGTFRLLPRNQFAPLIASPGQGSFYSTERKSYVAWLEAELGMESKADQIYCNTGPYSWMLELGEVSPSDMNRITTGLPPASLAKEQAIAWEFLWRPLSARDGRQGSTIRSVSPENRSLAHEMFDLWIRPKAGHSVLFRLIREKGADRLLLVTILSSDTNGASLSWRELKRFD